MPSPPRTSQRVGRNIRNTCIWRGGSGCRIQNLRAENSKSDLAHTSCLQQFKFTGWHGGPHPEVLPVPSGIRSPGGRGGSEPSHGTCIRMRLGVTRSREGPGGKTLGICRGRPPKARDASHFACASDAMPGDPARTPVSPLRVPPTMACHRVA
jgi:hypothetical protein